MRQARCDSACTLWSSNSLIKVVMTSFWRWRLLLVARQLWFFGKYAVFAPEIWTSASGNQKKKSKKGGISATAFSGSESTCAAEGDVSPLHTASVFPPTYWESHLNLVRSLHSSYSRLRLRNAKSKPWDKIWLLLFVCLLDSVFLAGIAWTPTPHSGSTAAFFFFYSAYSVVMSAFSSTSFKGNHLGGIKDNTGMVWESAEVPFLPRSEGISMWVFFVEMLSVLISCRTSLT